MCGCLNQTSHIVNPTPDPCAAWKPASRHITALNFKERSGHFIKCPLKTRSSPRMTRIHAKRNADHLTGPRGVGRVDGEDEQEHEQDQEQGETPWGAGAVNPVRTRINVG